MSVNSKMTAIADKIRALLGISGTMGLDAMATNLGTEQSNVTNAFTAVGNKGGTVPSSKVSGNLATAINSIPSGVIVQKKTGALTIDSNGTATVSNLGFKPDAIAFSTKADIYNVQMSASIMFTESNNDTLSLMHTSGDSNAVFAYWIVQRNSSGFTVLAANKVFGDFSGAVESDRYIDYTAIKYT